MKFSAFELTQLDEKVLVESALGRILYSINKHAKSIRDEIERHDVKDSPIVESLSKDRRELYSHKRDLVKFLKPVGVQFTDGRQSDLVLYLTEEFIFHSPFKKKDFSEPLLRTRIVMQRSLALKDTSVLIPRQKLTELIVKAKSCEQFVPSQIVTDYPGDLEMYEHLTGRLRPSSSLHEVRRLVEVDSRYAPFRAWRDRWDESWFVQRVIDERKSPASFEEVFFV